MNSELNNYLKNVDALLISTRSNIVYLTDFSGFSQTERECLLLVTKDKKYIITDGRYSEAVKKHIKGFELIEIGASKFVYTGYKSLKRLDKLTLGVEENNLTVAEYKGLKKLFKKLINIDLSEMRKIKNEQEINKIKLACKLADEAFNYIIKELKTGITEKEVANKIDDFLKRSGDNISFNPLVAFGNNSSMPHYESGKKKLTKNSIVLFDFGAWVNNYCSDLSRTVFFGKADSKFRKIYKTVLESQQKAINEIKHGAIANDVDKTARDYIVSKGYPNIIHSVGHGVGIEVHEPPILSPKSKVVLEKGMVFSVEPGIYFPGYGGVRIEDIVVVRESNAELISHSKREIIEVND